MCFRNGSTAWNGDSMPKVLKWALLALGLLVLIGVLWRLGIARAPGGANVTSWWRTPKKNREVGGVVNSRHLLGLAWDVQPKNQQMWEYLEGLGLKVLPMDAYPEHLHAQFTLKTPFLLAWRVLNP